MKKELLIASALVGSLGVAGVAQAATMSWSGNSRVGVEWEDKNDGTDTGMAASRQSSFNLSVSETTDNDVTISTGFALADEGTDEVDPTGLTLTFNESGVKLDIIEAGSAYASHLASVPSGGGEQGIAGSSGVAAPTGLDYADSNDLVGFELHSGADLAGVSGLKASVSASFNGDAAMVSSAHAVENSFSVGASYVSDIADGTTVTIGGGMIAAQSVASMAQDTSSTAISISAVTGDLSIGAGYASGDYVVAGGKDATEDVNMGAVSVLKAGAKYVSGKLTFNVGIADGEGKEKAIHLSSTQDAKANTYTKTSASVDINVAPGVTATLGYADEARESGGTATTAMTNNSYFLVYWS
jgi:hypothetical protein